MLAATSLLAKVAPHCSDTIAAVNAATGMNRDAVVPAKASMDIAIGQNA